MPAHLKELRMRTSRRVELLDVTAQAEAFLSEIKAGAYGYRKFRRHRPDGLPYGRRVIP